VNTRSRARLTQGHGAVPGRACGLSDHLEASERPPQGDWRLAGRGEPGQRQGWQPHRLVRFEHGARPVTTTEFVAVAGAIGTPVVALAGYAFNWVTSRGDREHSLKLAQGSQTHEERLRRAERNYDDRKSAYLGTIGFAVNAMRRVELTLPLMTYSGMQAPPEPLGDEETSKLSTAIVAFGTPEVDQLLNDFSRTVNDFFWNVGTVTTIRDQAGRGTHLADARTQLDASREAVRESYRLLTDRVREEIAAL
jgi:hypothetical protein